MQNLNWNMQNSNSRSVNLYLVNECEASVSSNIMRPKLIYSEQGR